MNSADPKTADRDIRLLDWQDHGDRDWTATAPGGWELSYAGARFSLLQGQSYNRPISTLSLRRRGKAPAGLLREGGFDQFAKRIGYAIEPQTGDADFDRRVYLATDDADLGRTLADRPEARRAVLDLFELEVRGIDIKADELTARLGESAHPDDDGGGALSNLALHLCALADLWPDGPPPGTTNGGGWFNRRNLSLAWFCVVATAVFSGWMFDSDRAWNRQLETFAETDWLGMGVLFGVAVAPYALLGGRRATSHRLLVMLVLVMLALLPISAPLRLINANRIHVRSETLVPAVPTALRPDPDRQYSKGYLLDATVEEHSIGLSLSPEEGKLAVEGRLCMAGVVHEGLRGLHYIWGLRTWTCRPGEVSNVPPPLPLPAAEDASS
jgi:hypothetical protein